MRSSTASVFLLSVLGASVLPAQGPGASQQTPEASTARDKKPSTPTFAPAAMPQDTDYSLSALYLNAHAEFQHKAQPYVFLHDADPFNTPIRASFLYQGQTEISSESGNLQWVRYDVNALIPIPVDRDVTLLVGGDFETRDYDFGGAFMGATQDDNYYRIDAQLGGTWFVDDDLSVTGLFSPGIYSDLDGTLNHKDWYFFGTVLSTYKASDTLFYKVGIAVDETFDNLPVYPIAGFAWIPNKDWRVDVLAPWGATVSWQAATETRLSAGLELEGAAYNIRSSPGTGSIQTENRIQELSLFVGVEHQFTDQLTAFGRFGTLLTGDYDIRTGAGPAIGTSDGHIDPAVFLEVGLGWKF
jgi:Domain of unknown function (DUF6268)